MFLLYLLFLFLFFSINRPQDLLDLYFKTLCQYIVDKSERVCFEAIKELAEGGNWAQINDATLSPCTEEVLIP